MEETQTKLDVLRAKLGSTDLLDRLLELLYEEGSLGETIDKIYKKEFG